MIKQQRCFFCGIFFDADQEHVWDITKCRNDATLIVVCKTCKESPCESCQRTVDCRLFGVCRRTAPWKCWSDIQIKQMMSELDLKDDGDLILFSMAREELDIREEENYYPYIQMESWRR